MPLLATTNQLKGLELEERVAAALKTRLSVQGGTYTTDEIDRITNLSRRLLPTALPDQETCDTLRTLAKLSDVELRPAREITSHRKFIGPLIVWLKRLTFPLIRIHLKDTFAAQNEFCSTAVFMLGRLMEENSKKRLKDS